MRAVLALAPGLRRAGGRDSVLTTSLAVTAFAVMTALTLSVVGGLLGFLGRAAEPVGAFQEENAEFYVVLAWTALVLLVVPLLTLGGSAARLGVARRDARLATLRLLGVTPREVVALTVVETAWQGLLGAVAGVAGYVVLLPVWTRVPFQGSTFTTAELWVGWPALLVACVAVPLLAVVSGVVSLRRVVVSPLGVARRQTPPGMRAVRVVLAVVAMGAFMVITSFLGAFGAAAMAFGIGSLALGFGALNLIGPWVLGLLGRWRAHRARTPAQLLAARRLVDDPKATWRVVGGLGLAGFVAGTLAVLPMIASTTARDADAAERAATATLNGDLMRGGLLTLGIAFLVAAAAAGIVQAASVLDRRRELALQVLAGTPVAMLDEVRRREVLVPMLTVAVGSAAVGVVMLSPVLGFAGVQDPGGLLLLVGCLTAGCLLVLGATEVSRPLLRSVLAQTQVRPD
ncbi:FtsX-like permease family protein [Cellulomonas triticagri]|uniref:FtsX-like permease family protein n=1 Tax=Cellulomonas triticagri TaxID=2483352 RepID=A0A3M2JBI7_9CELL|nr:FtsX-like permease family protein [Cellulomonas triticagri]RMI08883.1 FtsX-like permease family protein [Cellulomonas triticagri]